MLSIFPIPVSKPLIEMLTGPRSNLYGMPFVVYPQADTKPLVIFVKMWQFNQLSLLKALWRTVVGEELRQ